MRKKSISFISLVACDFFAILLCFFLAYLVRKNILPSIYSPLQLRPVFFHIYLRKSFIFGVWAGVFLYEKLYTKRFSFWDEARILFKSNTISFGLIMILVFITQEYLQFSRPIIFLSWLFSIVFFPLFRYFTKLLLIKFNLWQKKVVIVGTPESCSSLIKAINQNKTLGYEVVGCLSDERKTIGQSILGIKVLGHIDEIEQLKKESGFEDIIVTLPDIPRDKFVPLLKQWEQFSDTIHYIPRTGDLISTGVEIENIGKILSLTIRKNLHKPWNIFLKNISEFFLAFFLMIICLPFFIIISLAIVIDSKGPIFFIQERFGKRGKKIKLIKFRSMYNDANERLEQYINDHPQAKEEYLKFRKLKSFDPRVTKVGKFLRKYSLDELPQLLNVLKGDMCLVGPRPYIMEEIKETTSVKTLILQVKPGITGLWQISGRSMLPFQERLNLDEYYIRNWNLWLDLVILIKTVKVSFSGAGAF